jgi:hypothetical protein
MRNNFIKTYLFFYQLIGAVLGLILILLVIIKIDPNEISSSALLLLVFSLIYCLFSLYSAFALKGYWGIKYSLILTIINQIINVFDFSIFGFRYQVSSEPGLFLGILNNSHQTSFIFNFQYSGFNLGFNEQYSNALYITFNVLPVLNLILIYTYLRKPNPSIV